VSDSLLGRRLLSRALDFNATLTDVMTMSCGIRWEHKRGGDIEKSDCCRAISLSLLPAAAKC
jgi:hypothetical protein